MIVLLITAAFWKWFFIASGMLFWLIIAVFAVLYWLIDDNELDKREIVTRNKYFKITQLKQGE